MATFKMMLAVVTVLVTCYQLCSARPPTAMDAALAAMDEAQADFAVNLLRTCSPSEQSSVISAFSVTVALAMVYAGAAGKTEREMAQILAGGQSQENFGQYLYSLLRQMNQNGSSEYILEVANRLYARSGTILKPDYMDIIQRHFGGELKEANFGSQAKEIAKEVNDWVSERTRGKITNMVNDRALTADTKLLLVNAVYFKGAWARRFDIRHTKEKIFHTASGQQKPVSMMSIDKRFPYYEDKDVKVLSMPYEGEGMEMYIILPIERFGLAKVESEMTGRRLLQYIDKCRAYKEVEVEIPRFTVRHNVPLSDKLAHLGMRTAFSNAANFSGISDGPLWLDTVQHEAVIEVNEKGTEAAAATSFTVCDGVSFHKVYKFHAHHPFLFFVVKDEQTILFSGRYTGPADRQ